MEVTCERGDIGDACNKFCSERFCALFASRVHNFFFAIYSSFDIEKKSEVTGTKDNNAWKEGRIETFTCHMAIPRRLSAAVLD